MSGELHRVGLKEFSKVLGVGCRGPVPYLAPLLDQVCDIFGRARKDGIILNFNISADQYGRMRVNEVSAVKPL